MSNLDTFTRWIDAVNAGDTSVIDDVVGEQIVDHHLPPGIPSGREGVRQWMAMLIDSLQLHLDVQDTVVQGDLHRVASDLLGHARRRLPRLPGDEPQLQG